MDKGNGWILSRGGLKERTHVYRILGLKICRMDEGSELQEQTGAGCSDSRERDSRVTVEKEHYCTGWYRWEESLERTYCPPMLKKLCSYCQRVYLHLRNKLSMDIERWSVQPHLWAASGCLLPSPRLYPWAFCGNVQGSLSPKFSLCSKRGFYLSGRMEALKNLAYPS